MIRTRVEDWTVNILARTQAEYCEQLELLSFEFSYRGSRPEKLEGVPFARGTQESDLLVWLTAVPAGSEDTPSAA